MRLAFSVWRARRLARDGDGIEGESAGCVGNQLVSILVATQIGEIV